MKNVIFYTAVSGFYIAEFLVKNQKKTRKIPVGNTEDSLRKAVKRYAKKGYSTFFNDGVMLYEIN